MRFSELDVSIIEFYISPFCFHLELGSDYWQS